jgi:hypothetical protein
VSTVPCFICSIIHASVSTADPGYNMFEDSDLMGTIQALKSKVKRKPKPASPAKETDKCNVDNKFGLDHARDPSVVVEFVARTGYQENGISLPPSSRLSFMGMHLFFFFCLLFSCSLLTCSCPQWTWMALCKSRCSVLGLHGVAPSD